MNKRIAQNNLLTCPNCNHTFPIADVLGEKLKASWLEEYKKNFDVEKQAEITAVAAKAREEANAKILNELKKTTKDNTDLKAELEGLKLKDKDSKKREDNRVQEAVRLAVNKVEDEKNREIKQEETKNKRLLKQLNAAQKSAGQVSTELQGTAAEAVIEGRLKELFPGDTVQPTPKGRKGADCLLRVRENATEVGSILFESKDTKVFQTAWVNKLKKDQIAAKADFGVIVTTAWPAKAKQEGVHISGGVYICRPHEFETLAVILRETVKKIAGARDTKRQEHLFAYFTSSQFEDQFTQIFKPVLEMQKTLVTDENALRASLKKRRSQIERMMEAAFGFYHTIQGHDPNVPRIEFLEPPEK